MTRNWKQLFRGEKPQEKREKTEYVQLDYGLEWYEAEPSTRAQIQFIGNKNSPPSTCTFSLKQGYNQLPAHISEQLREVRDRELKKGAKDLLDMVENQLFQGTTYLNSTPSPSDDEQIEVPKSKILDRNGKQIQKPWHGYTDKPWSRKK